MEILNLELGVFCIDVKSQVTLIFSQIWGDGVVDSKAKCCEECQGSGGLKILLKPSEALTHRKVLVSMKGEPTKNSIHKII